MKFTNFFRIALALLIFTGISASALTAQSWPPAGMAGSGTETAPWEIESPAHLKVLADYVNAGNSDQTIGKYYKLMNDLDLSSYAEGEGWKPIGFMEQVDGSWIEEPFQGHFNGNGKVVTNLTINRPTEDNIGLFGYIYEVATIKNLGVINCNVTGNSWVGGLLGMAEFYDEVDVTINNCYVTGIVNGSNEVGGLVGTNLCTIENCYADVAVTSTGYGPAGGLTGNNYYGVIKNCYATSTVSGNNQVGGLMGRSLGTVENCYATGNVTGTNRLIGGLCGGTWDMALIKNCYATGNVSGLDYVGGLMGQNYDGSIIQNCYATGNVSGDYLTGGLVGVNNSATIINSVAANNLVTISASGTNQINRITGRNLNDGTLFNNYANEDMVVEMEGETVTITPDLNGPEGANATIAQLQSVAFYTTPENWEANEAWDFAVWNVCEGENMFPFLRWQGIDCGGEHIPVTDITDLPETAMAGVPITLTGTVQPVNATYTAIVWSVENAGTTGANITDGNILNTTAQGTVQIKAAIEDGTAIGTPYEKLFNIEVSQAFCGGDGSEDDPYKICSPEDLNEVRNMLDKHFILMNNIDLTDFISDNYPTQGWLPIGNNDNIFTGSFDGNGHKITGLTINRQAGNYIGLFGRTDALIKDLGIENCNIIGNMYVGGLVGVKEGIVENCYVTGIIEGKNYYTGGLIGSCWGSIKNCYTVVTVTGTSIVGGLVGRNFGFSIIENCYSMGSVSGNREVGGIAGHSVNNSTISNCVAANETVSAENVVNRISGTADGTFSNNYAFEDMVVLQNGVPITVTPDLNYFTGADASLETLQAEVFYTTESFWHENAWDFTVWDICNAEALPWLKWENIVCDGIFIPVTNITDVPTEATINEPLTLTATVVPITATNQTIVWTVENAGSTGATIAGNIFIATAEGTAQIKATIENGTAIGTPYEQLFEIEAKTVGIDDVNTHGRAYPQIYPNPTTGVFFVRHCGLDPQSPQNNGMLKQVQHDAALEIYDIAGRIVHREPCTVHRATVTIDITHLANGIYFIKIDNETIKIVKN